MKNFFKKVLVGIALLGMTMAIVPVTFAQGTILPVASSDGDCIQLINSFNQNADKKQSGSGLNDILGCAIKTGRISLAMIPYFIQIVKKTLAKKILPGAVITSKSISLSSSTAPSDK